MKSRLHLQFTSYCLAALSVLLLPVLSAAAELKPFLTVHLGSPEAFISVIEKFADLSGNGEAVAETLAPFKDIQGVNVKGNIGIVLQSTENNELEFFAVLPITDIEKATIPGQEMVFEMIRAGLTKEAGGYYSYKSPFGNYVIRQKKDYITLAPEKSEKLLPDDPQVLFQEFDKQLLGVKVNYENTTPEAIETIIAPIGALMAMTGNEQGGEFIDNLTRSLKDIFEEYSATSGSLSVDTETLDIVANVSEVAKKGSDTAKKLESLKGAKTVFSGFAGNPAKTIAWFNAVSVWRKNDVKSIDEAVDNFVEGFQEGLAEAAEDLGYTDGKLAKDIEQIIASVKKVIKATTEKKLLDAGASLDSEGTVLAAFTLGDTDELAKLVKDIIDLAKSYSASLTEKDVKFDIAKYVNKDYKTVADYSVSKLTLPVKDVIALFADEDAKDAAAFDTVTLNAFWAVKANEAVAVGFGLNAAHTEEAFLAALEKTKNPIAVPTTVAAFSIKPVGEFLKQFLPLVDMAQTSSGKKDDSALKSLTEVVKLLSNADGDAKAVVDYKITDTTSVVDFKVSGKLVTVLFDVVKKVTSVISESLDRPAIQDLP
jgi:hypothetical protein